MSKRRTHDVEARHWINATLKVLIGAYHISPWEAMTAFFSRLLCRWYPAVKPDVRQAALNILNPVVTFYSSTPATRKRVQAFTLDQLLALLDDTGTGGSAGGAGVP